MKCNLSPDDVILVSPGIGIGINMPNLEVPLGAKDKDQFTAKVTIFHKRDPAATYDIVLEVAPASVSTMGKAIPRHIHGFVRGDIGLDELKDSSYEIEEIQPSAGFTLNGAI